MFVFVDTPNPVPPHRIEVDETTTVYLLKQYIYMKSKIPSAKQILKYSGEVCKDTEKVMDLLKDSRLTLFRVEIKA